MPAEATEAPWISGLAGARAHLRPALALQAAALALVLAYYHWAPARDAMAGIMALKLRIGFAFGMATTGLFGGVLPFLYLRRAPALHHAPYDLRQGAALTAFWTYKGLEIELLYRGLARLVGPGHDAATIATKVFLDQFAYCPLFAVPATVVVYAWVDGHFGPAFAADWRAPRWYARRVMPVLVSNLGVWIPAVAIVYALPTPLQLPLQNLVLCFFTLLVAHQTRTPLETP